MRNTALLLGLMLTGTFLPEHAVCWIDPMTGRPYLARCEKPVKKSTRAPAAEKAKAQPEMLPADAGKKPEEE